MPSNTRPPRGSKAKGGPAREPSNLRVLKGGKPNPGEPVPGDLPVSPPKHLSPAAREEWDRLAPDLQRKGLLTGWDVEAFAIYCEAVAGRHIARRLVDDEGLLVEGRGGMVRNPAFQLWRDQAMLTLTAASRFGLSPSDRAGLPANKSGDDAEALFSK